jgi:16S rRNA (cytidine1402-2'-O)-methyltransferase
VRALAILAEVDAIACEDTRVTARLLAIHGIRRPLVAYHDHNERQAAPALVERIRAGARVALVTDAGTPLVSDPGYRLVGACAEADLPVVPVPGASAVLAALGISGLPTDRFFFAGFLPPRAAARRRSIAAIAWVPSTLVLLETALRLPASLADLAEGLGSRRAVVARELTKRFEEVRRGSLATLAEHYAGAGTPKGEVTLVIAPPPTTAGDADLSASDIDDRLCAAMRTRSPRAAAEEIAGAANVPFRRLYARALALRRSEKK